MRIMDTPLAYSYKPITSNLVGSWRFVEPSLLEKTPPCQSQCPIQHSIREIFAALEKNQENEAFWIMADKNPLLYTTGTVCPHTCEQGCSRNDIDNPLAISYTEAYLGKKFLESDLNILQKSKALPKKIAVIGAGPAGLSLAFQLAMHGAKIDVFEREAEPGGLIRYGIPDSRVNKTLLKKEIQRLLDSFPNISLSLGQTITPDQLKVMETEYDRLFLATGNQFPHPAHLPDIATGLETLIHYHKGNYKFPQHGHYLVLGSGNTAMDVACYLLENKNQVTLISREEKNRMNAYREEIEQVEKNGGEILPSAQLKAWNNKTKIAVVTNFDQEKIFQADGIYACFGQKAEKIWEKLPESPKIVKIGDITGNTASVAHAIGNAYEAACLYLAENQIKPLQHDLPPTLEKDSINLDYWRSRTETRYEDTVKEAQRCIQCGICTGCKVCETFCPDFAIEIRENKADFDLTYCKGCEICSTECPRGAIKITEANRA